MKSSHRALCAAAVGLLVAAALAPILKGDAASAPSWKQCGWGGGGFYYSAVYHPTKDGVIYLGGDVNGVYRSDDHGLHFKMISNGLAAYGVFSLAVDPSNPDTVYAANDGGLCKSTDEGEHWQLLPHTGPHELHITGEKGHSIRSVAVDPRNGNIVFAASPAGQVYKSTDGGQTWNSVYRPVVEAAVAGAKAGTIYSVSIAAKDSALVLASTNDAGVVLSKDGGSTWHELPTPKKASSAVFAPTDANIIYASFFTDGVRKSTDQGKTWTDISTGLAKNFSVREIVVSPVNPLDVYAIGSIATWAGGFYLTHDGGSTWTRVGTMTTDLENDPTLGQGSGQAGLSGPTNLTINPRNPQEMFMSANWRSGLSMDGGATWTERDRGADMTCTYDIRFSDKKTYVTAMDEGTFMSPDGGDSWRQLWPRKFSYELSGHNWRIGVTPVKGADHLVGTVSPWDAKYPNRVVVSDDGGSTYKIATSGLPDYIPHANTMWGQGYARALSVDPNNPDVVYLGIDGDPEAGKSGGGIFKSVDGGNTWAQLEHQPASRRVFFGLQVDPTDSKRIFWGACGSEPGLYRTEDGGETWSKNLLPTSQWIFNLLVTSDGTIYCPAQNLWRSTDHGATWKMITKFTGDRVILGLEVDPRDLKTIWISQTTWDGTSNGAVYKSTDAGATWQDITGNIPNVKPMILRFNPATNELWAGGPGLYKIEQKPTVSTPASK